MRPSTKATGDKKETGPTSKAERSPDGRRILRHDRPAADEFPAVGDAQRMAAIERHITKHLGPPKTVFHEILSSYVHIDIHVVEPTTERPYWFLVTSGMSDKPMKTPRGLKEGRFAEIAVALPASWKLDEKSLKSERWYWPIRLIKTLARMPHAFETWLFYDHSTQLDNEPGAGYRFTGAIMSYDSELPEKFVKLRHRKETVWFMTPIPIYQEELDLLLRDGPDALHAALATLGDFDTFDTKRANSVGKPRKPAAGGSKRGS